MPPPTRRNSAPVASLGSRSVPDVEKGVVFDSQFLRGSPEMKGESDDDKAIMNLPIKEDSSESYGYLLSRPDASVPTSGLPPEEPPVPVTTGDNSNQPTFAHATTRNHPRLKSRIDSHSHEDEPVATPHKAKTQDEAAETPQKSKTQDEWVSVMEAMTKHDLHMVQSGKEGIDSLLVFAGLFSTVLTAFNVVTFGFLQTDPNKSTPLILAQISQQLSALTIADPGTIRSIQPPYMESPPARTSRSMVAVNALWFSSLVLSLTSASIGILIKQWLQAYAASTSSQVYDSVCIRQHRVDGYRRWRVSMFIKLLPFLLQLSLLLFFIGLVILLWTENRAVAGVVGGLVFLWFTCWFATIVLPTIDGTCPYKSAEAWAFFALIQFIKPEITWIRTKVELYLRRFIAACLQYSAEMDSSESFDTSSSSHVNSSWREREMDLIKGCKPLLAWRAVEWTRDSLMDEMMFAAAIRAYVDDPRQSNMAKVVNYLWNHLSRSTGVNSGNLWSWIPDNSNVTCALMQSALQVLKAIPRDDHSEGQQPNDGEGRKSHEGSEQLIVALARYAHCRSKDAPDNDVIEDIKNLPLLINLGRFPLKNEFLSTMDTVKRKGEAGVGDIDDLAANYASVWFNRRKHWIIEDFDDFIHVSTTILQLVTEIPPDTVHGSVGNGNLKSFLLLLQDLGECVKPQRAREMNVVHRDAFKDLRRSIHDLAYAQPSLLDHLKDCITTLLYLSTSHTSTVPSRHVDQGPHGDEDDPMESVIASDLHVGNDWYALAMREEHGRTVMQGSGLQFQLRTTFDPKGRVECICFSPDGKYIGEVRRKSVQIYASETLSDLAILCEEMGSEIQTICFSPDSTSIATATTHGAIRIWKIDTEAIVIAVQEQGTCGDYLEFTRDGRLLLSKDARGVVQVWNIKEGSCMTLANMNPLYTYNGSCSAVFSPDGNLIATGSADGFVHIWDVAAGTIIDQYKGHSGRIESVVFNSDQTKIISGSHDQTVKIWDVQITKDMATGILVNSVGRIPVTLEGHMGKVTAVSLSNDGRWIVSGSDRNLYIWDAGTGVLRYFIDAHQRSVQYVKYSPTQNLLITGDREGLLKLWEYKLI